MGMQRTFGTGAATNSIEDLKYTDCIMVIGANPTSGHPVTGARLKQFAIKGKTTIVIDPRRTELARYATHHLQLKPGTNVALLNMMLHYIISEGLEDQAFIESRTTGYAEMKEHLLGLNMDELSAITGVDKELVKQAAIAYATAPNAMSFHGLGVTEHTQGTFTVMQIADLAMITGNIGRRGVGVNPLRGQNNVQGAADMGCQPHQGAGYLNSYDPEINKKYELHYGTKVTMGKGLKIPEMFDASIKGNLKAMWLMGEDIAQTDPNTCHVINALEHLDLLVIQEIFSTETCKYATVVLPASSFLEKSGTFTNGERRVQRVNAAVDPLPGTKPDGQIISEVMQRMGFDQPDYDPDVVLEEIARIVPFFAGIKWKELGKNGKQWPVKPDGTDTEILHTEEFKIGKGVFHSQKWVESEELRLHAEEYPYIITTNRELEHYNAGTMSRRTKNVEILKEDVLLINPIDAKNNGIAHGDMVFVESPRGHVYVKAKVTDEVLPGILSSTFHFPEIMLNRITSNVADTETMCPEFKVVSCRIHKHVGEVPNEPYICPV
jgi:formate dehydrogenase major subunit